MTDIPDRWSRVAGLFDQVLQRPRAERAEFLDAACQADLGLKAEVQALLDADDRAAGFLTDPATALGPLLLGDAAPAVPSGAMFGPYRVERPLGQGGMGEVYLAEDTRLGRLVTLKILHARDTGDDRRRERLRFEARAAASLVHPNIATVHALEDLSGQLCIVSEYVAGRTAREVLETTGPMPVEEAIDVALQVARGLGAAHRHGIIHRDLKPENILIGEDRAVRILDFGVARTITADPPAQRLTDTGVMVGTPGYMAPEQLEGGAGDVRSDLFAFGTVMYELVTGRNPFQGRTASSTAARILAAEPEPLCRVNPLFPRGLEAIVSRCLKKDPAGRYAGAAEVAVDLQSLARGLAIRAPATRPAGEDAEEPGHDSPARALWRAHQGIILGLLTGLLIGSWWLAAWLGTPWRVAFFAAVLALTVADGTIRVHLLFVEHAAPASVRVQLARTQRWRRSLDMLVALIIAPAAALVLDAHEIAGILMLGVSTGIGAATWVIEPTTTEAAFPRSSSLRRGGPG